MDDTRFDALTRFVAKPRTRRQLVQTLGGGTLAVLGGLVGSGRVSAADCPSGVVCSAQCCPHASNICLAGQCTSCPSRVICSALCCPNSSDICVAGRCTNCPSGVICRAQCCPNASDTCQAGRCTPTAAPCGNAGAACTDRSDCCSPLICSGGACAQPKGSGSPCQPGYRECDGVCYPGGCCTDADCGAPCLVCTDHICGGCPAGQTCQNGTCGPTCTPKTCQAEQCGTIADGCGGTLDCGSCPSGQCLICAAGTCVVGCPAPQVCHQGLCCSPQPCQAGQCGAAPDGCGGTHDCGGCDASHCQTCDAASHTCGSTCPGGTVCQAGSCCTPDCAGKTCGDDGCGGSCGSCPSGQACLRQPLGAGVPAGQCCVLLTCEYYRGYCGYWTDGCGGSINCPCPAGQICCPPGSDCAGRCCRPATCPVGANCGTLPDGCGGSVTCGPATCTGTGQTCGGGGTPNVCGCTPQCAGKTCGADGCGGTCGTCGAGETCCGDTCANLSTDVNHCGGCGTVCQGRPDDPLRDGEVYACKDGQCALTGCQPHFSVCGPPVGCCSCNSDGKGWTCTR